MAKNNTPKKKATAPSKPKKSAAKQPKNDRTPVITPMSIDVREQHDVRSTPDVRRA